MKRVQLESPYGGDIERNKRYLQACIRDCLNREETPYASHQMLTDALRDSDTEQRQWGIAAGFAMREVMNCTVVYTNLGISGGMRQGITHAKVIRHPVEYRTLPEDWDK